MSLLEKYKGTADIKTMQLIDMEKLATEVRELIIQTVSVTGGHLAPSLGVVDLTIALHYVFDTLTDKFIWDVGHQAYCHKILTGRGAEFHTLRQYGGLSGFPKREESSHDAFNTGHSSTSISAALGFALARDRLGENHNVVGIIGDGALTGGQAYEAMNQAGHLGVNMLVVLNDNEMSIAQNVGAMSSYLSRLRSDPLYTKRKKEIEDLLSRVPAIGSTVVKAAEKMKDSLKYLFLPGILFEELGFTYLGPIDGHNIKELIHVLYQAKNLKGPVLLHVLTQKGRGYEPAVQKPADFHGVGSFDRVTGNIHKKAGPPTYTQIFGETLVDLALRDNRLLAVTAAMPEGTGLSNFAAKFPQRFYDVGIAEQNAVTMSAAMALRGLRPVMAIYSTFLQRAYDQVVHDVCLQKAPVIFAVDRAGLVGEDGPTHHGAFDISFLRHIPGISVMAPKDEEELRHMLYTALQYDGPVAIRYPRGKAVGVPLTKGYDRLPWGRGEVLADGDDLLVLAVGAMVYPALKVKEILGEYGISCSVINARFIKPLDEDLVLEFAKKHKYLVTIEENVLAGGFGSAVLELLSSHQISQVSTLNLGLPDEFVRHGSVDQLLDLVDLTPEKIVQTILTRFSLKRRKTLKPKVSFLHRFNE